MRLLITILTLAMLSSPTHAKPKSKTAAKHKTAAHAKPSVFTGKLLSYQALVRLPKAKRMRYLRDTIELLATMESFNNKYTVAERSQLRELQEQVAQLMNMVQILPEAKADEYDDDGAPAVDIAAIVPFHKNNRWTCGEGAKFDSVFRTCVVMNNAGLTAFSPASSSEEGAIKCPAGSKEVPHYRGESVACVPNAAWARLSSTRKAALEAKNFELPRSFHAQTFEQQRLAVLGGPNGSAPPVAPTAPASQAPVAPATPQPVDAGDATTIGAGDVPTITPSGRMAETLTPQDVPVIGADGEPAPAQPSAPNASAPANETAAPADPPTPPTERAATPPAAAPAPAAETCEPAVHACKKLTAAERETAINRFRTSEPYQGVDANICVAGGFASKYRGNKKEAGNCEVQSSILLGNGRMTAPCAADEALCNPVLFCVGAKNPEQKFENVTFCVKKKGNRMNREITDACASKYAKMVGGPLFECAKVDPKATAAQKRKAKAACDASKKIKGEACDPAYMPGDINFKKVWEELTAATVKLRDVWCGKLDFAALFCRECEIVNDQIYAMNKNAINKGCEDVAPGRSRSLTETAPPVTPQAPASSAPNAVRDGATEEERPDGR